MRIQKTDIDNFKSFLVIFMILHDLRANIYKENDLIKNNFPLKLGGLDLEIGQTYYLEGIF